jgi:membrane associated rhomboid family serine protease
MALHDRQYWRDEEGTTDGASGLGRLGAGLSAPPKVVKWLLLLNLGVFVLQLVVKVLSSTRDPIDTLSLYFGATTSGFWEVWRYVTFQFLHDTRNLWHIGLNMLALYMCGAPLERHWGSRHFLRFYLTCGVAAGLAYVVIGALRHNPGWMPLIGASGGVYGILLACAVLMPDMRLILVFFPVPIRLAVVIIFGAMILSILGEVRGGLASGDFWSSVAHLGGAGMAAAWLWIIPKAQFLAAEGRKRSHEGAWKRKLRQRNEAQAEVDRILRKIHDEGLESLTRGEKGILRDATRRQREEEEKIRRM